MVSLVRPALSFLRIQNNDNGGIILLAPSHPWRQQTCFVVTVVTIICANRSSSVTNNKRTRGEGANSSCTLFARFPLLMANCVIFVVVREPPYLWRQRRRLAAALLIAIHHSMARALVNGERIGEGRAGLVSWYNTQSVEKTQTIYRPGWRLGKEDKGEGEEEVNFWLPSFGAAAMAFILEVTQQSTHGGAEI